MGGDMTATLRHPTELSERERGNLLARARRGRPAGLLARDFGLRLGDVRKLLADEERRVEDRGRVAIDPANLPRVFPVDGLALDILTLRAIGRCAEQRGSTVTDLVAEIVSRAARNGRLAEILSEEARHA